MTRIKICGITRAEDAELVCELGADFAGFVFAPDSPRYVDPARAPQTHGVQRVGVFRNATAEFIGRAIELARLDLVQLHGGTYSGFPVIQAFRVGESLPDCTTTADYVLFDTGGGTGRTFDWELLSSYRRDKPFFLAGGLTPDNVAEAIARVAPDVVDVASGVESSPGIKDHQKLRTFFERVKR
ncbi:MAG TPA: phosphoribosylanthranilate isomerase [Thermoanaerobaculia bacterium]|jgi:phosphoribosylanthranilate isomerase